MPNKNPVVHFEMPYDDRDRMVEFYAKSFGWEANKLGPEMGDYVVAMTTETDAKTNLSTTPGAINGGFFKRAKSKDGPSLVIAVDDIRAAMQQVVDAGGKVIGGSTPGEPDMIPGVGMFCSIEDSEGNHVSMLQPS